MKLAHRNALFASLAVEAWRMLCLVEEMGVQIEGKQSDGIEGGGIPKETWAKRIFGAIRCEGATDRR